MEGALNADYTIGEEKEVFCCNCHPLNLQFHALQKPCNFLDLEAGLFQGHWIYFTWCLN